MIRRWLAIAAIVVAAIAIGMFVWRSYVYVPVLNDGEPGIHDIASLPDHLHMCGRDWTRDSLDRQSSMGELVATYGFAPPVTDPGLLTPCPQGPCGWLVGTPCDTVVFVRVGDDAYLSYSLEGGP